jgi:hypothetical protein
VLVGEQGDAGRIIACGVDPVRAMRTDHEAHDVAWFQRLFAVRRCCWTPWTSSQMSLRGG